MQPARDMIVVDALPGGTLDPTVDRSLPLDRQTGSAVGIDATFPFGRGTLIARDGQLSAFGHFHAEWGDR